MNKRALRVLFPGSEEKKEVEIIHTCDGCDMALVKHSDGRTESVMPSYLESISETAPNRRFKVLKFAHRIPPEILAGDKQITWRIDDEKGIEAGDVIKLATNDTDATTPGEVFGVAEVLWVKQTSMGLLSAEDKKFHAPFASDDDIYRTYSRYYRKPVGPKTPVKVIKFRLLSVPAAALPAKVE
ncbi:MAG: hypothetical protein ACHQ0Y_04865 [Thermodesulfovibrionales bacterium]